MHEQAQQPTVETKTAPGYVTDDGQQIAEHVLYRLVGPDGLNSKGVWYSTMDRAVLSYQRRRESADA